MVFKEDRKEMYMNLEKTIRRIERINRILTAAVAIELIVLLLII